MNYWLMKSEPSSYSIDDLARDKRTRWDGVRNYQARNMLRDDVAKGDLVFIYHSSCAEPAITGVAEIVRSGYPDPTQFDPEDAHFDPGSRPDAPRWIAVDIRYKRRLRRPIPLAELKSHRRFATLQLLQRGNR
ncbi:MAG: EVE domain-containing protein, partial [Gammaproteobacteria bacterium]